MYLLWLFDEQRFAEAQRQLERFRALQPDSLAHAPYVAMVELGNERYAAAAKAAAPLILVARDSGRAERYRTPLGWDFRIGMLTWFSAAGRLRDTREAGEILLNMPGGPPCAPIPDGRCIVLPREMPRRVMTVQLRQAFTAVPAEARRALREAIAAGRRDTLAHLVFVSANPGSALAYRITRDTTLLSEWIRASRDTIFPFAYAALVLARGDSTHARRLFERHASVDREIPDYSDPRREDALLNRYAWADVLAALGERRRALDIYEQLDSTRREVLVPTASQIMHVMSLAERALLHEQLGERERAIELYDAFVEAWQDADPELQPMVRRARDAAERLRGGGGDRPPGA
jgi:tetratricopeptide (TPR) repeat protein